jgi:2-aminoethylphosphonate-pyruvate transaminase
LEHDLNLDKHLLFTPGPVNVAETLRTAICKEDICHRETDFDDLLAGIEHKLLSLFQIRKRERYRSVVITGSGTAANEAILSSVVGNGAILILSNGEFGGRLHKTSLIHNKQTHLIEMPWGVPFDVAQIAAYLLANKIDVVAMVHHETCSGMLNPLAQIGALAKACGALFVVDGVSSVGAEVIDMEACNIAFVSSSSSKALSGLVVCRGPQETIQAAQASRGENHLFEPRNILCLPQDPQPDTQHACCSIVFRAGSGANGHSARGRSDALCAHQGAG